MTELKLDRIKKKLTQREAADRLGVSLRSYIMYENDESRVNTLKYRFMLQEMEKLERFDEEHGILTVNRIQEVCRKVFDTYPVEFCYLFGSYAKGKATGTSDVDLLISTRVTGLRFYELTETLREALGKKIDLLNLEQLLNNAELLRAILKDGVRIYG